MSAANKYLVTIDGGFLGFGASIVKEFPDAKQFDSQRAATIEARDAAYRGGLTEKNWEVMSVAAYDTNGAASTNKFKFEGFAVGDQIRARDFEDRPGRGLCAVEGRIFQVLPNGSNDRGYAHYAITCTRDMHDGRDMTGQFSRVGVTVFVPMETSLDYDNRVELVERAS